MHINSIAIIGAGTMGQGISIACATKGFNVLLFDLNEAALSKALSTIEKNLQISVEKGKLSIEQKTDSLNRISAIHNLSEAKADLIIEAAIERLDVKKEIFLELEKINSTESILTSNTSSIPITQIASVLKHPNRFAGLHFFNPANIMKLVEIIDGVSTSKETITLLTDFTKKLDKVSVLAKDAPGFIVNRVARHYYVESLKILEENICDIPSIDKLLRSTGFKMGPFELMDLIGVDVNFSVTQSMFESFFNDSKFRPSRIQQQKVAAGHHGKKSGKGFYNY